MPKGLKISLKIYSRTIDYLHLVSSTKIAGIALLLINFSNSARAYMWKTPFIFLIVIFGSFLNLPLIGTSQNKYVVNVIQPDPVQAPELNRVTVSSENKTMVEWIQKPDKNILYFNIYRYTPDTGDGWIKVGNATYPGTNSFSDASSFPTMQSYQYRIATIDKCGNERFNFRIHRSIKLNLIHMNDSNYSLTWNPYEGFEVTTYKIYRGEDASNLVLMDSTMAMNTNYVVQKTIDTKIFYQIEAIGKPDTMITEKSLSQSSRKTYSNICSNKSLFSDSTNAPDIQIYPNPMTIAAMVIFPYYPNEKYNLSILDLTGNIVYSQPIFSGQIEIKRNKLKEGMYILQIASRKKLWKKLIIGRI
ncbi:MAG TPA: T9SS type A sorting domain-containing protein [Prolixibacteraceae bacterium]|nr:T9SS type A sorting domain-containing protein [Prolixibacteraceae bacterium]